MKILMTIGRLNIGGAEKRLLDLFGELRSRELPIEIMLYIVSGKKGVLDEAFEALGVQLFYGSPGFKGLIVFMRLCVRYRPTVVHANSGSAGGFYCLAALILGVGRRITHIRSAGPTKKSWFNKHGLVYEPITSLASNVIIGVSDACREHQYFPRNKWRVIYDGLELGGSNSSPASRTNTGKNVIVLGRLHHVKNIRHAISAFGLYCERYSDREARLNIVGPEGDQGSDELLAFAGRLGIDQQVFYHGATDVPLVHLSQSDVLLLPSVYEGLPGVVIEALSCGTPVIASDIRPAREISLLTSGVVVVPIDDLEQWADQIFQTRMADRSKIVRDFNDRSPFVLSKSCDSILSVWRS